MLKRDKNESAYQRRLSQARKHWHKWYSKPENREKKRQDNKRWDASNKDKKKRHSLWNLYGLTDAEYRSILESQGGKCAICRHDEKLCVDHCHKTKKVRGILCDSCNNGIGRFKDNPRLMVEAILYLSA